MLSRLILAVVLLVPSLLFAATSPGVFVEVDGLLVIEMESIGSLPGEWRDADSFTEASAIDAPETATGGNFILWEGEERFNTIGEPLLRYLIDIETTGTYRFQWRSQVGQGNNTTEHNDSWLKIEASAFFGEKGDGSRVCPRGFDPSENDCSGQRPNGSGKFGWFKVYSGHQDWRWGTRTSDNDAHDIYARFDRPGRYVINITGRSDYHVIDRMILYHGDYQGRPRDLSQPPSPLVAIEPLFADRFEVVP
jgi:hypothetical protein